MNDDAARFEGPQRVVFARAASGMRLVEFVDEQGHVTRYAYDDARGVVTSREADGSTTEYAVPPGRMLARVRHPETGAWLHVCLPVPPLATGQEASAWPTQWAGSPSDGVTAAQRVGGSPAPPRDSPVGPGIITVTYDAAMLDDLHRFGQVTSYTYDRNDKLIGVRTPGGQIVTYTYDRDGRLIADDEA